MLPAIDTMVFSGAEGDPLHWRAPLPFVATYYPIGFPLEIATNSQEVLAVAGELWAGYPRLSRSKPVRLHVAVEGTNSNTVDHTITRGREHLVLIAQPPGNFAVADLSRGFVYASLTHNLAADPHRFRYYFLEPLAYLMIDSRHATPLHAACVALTRGAVVLCGESGAGKTSLAYACARRGWMYLSDDATHVLHRSSGHIVAGRPHRIRFRASARHLFPELNAFPPVLRPNGKCDLEVDTERLGIATAYRAPVRAIVFLCRRAGTVPVETFSVSREKARQALEQVLCYGDERIRKRQRATLDHFLELPLVELRYQEINEAERVLRRLVT